MIDITGDLFNPETYRWPVGHDWPSEGPNLRPDAICITTNGFVKKNGEAVMGRGCARTAAQLMPGLPETLGSAIRSHGNQVYVHGPWNGIQIVTFPVKGMGGNCAADKSNVVRHMQNRFEPGQRVPGWALVASLPLINRSAEQLRDIALRYRWQAVVLPRPGCGVGELSWPSIREALRLILDDRFYAITFP